MTRLGVVVLGSLSLILAALGCAGERATPAEGNGASPPSWRLRYRLTGGAAGYDVTFVVDASGAARYARRSPRAEMRALTLDSAEVAALEQAVVTSGFRNLGPSYAPQHSMNGYRYSIEWQAAAERHQVVAEDGVPLPAAFLAVREAIAVLQRRVLRDGKPVLADDEGKE